MQNIFKNTSIIILFIILFSTLNGCYPISSVSVGTQYSNPAWATDYYSGVRYYYFPDIETYYDLANQDFVYLDNGQWMFSNSLPSMYSGYNLYTSYEIALNVNVYEPWMHHHYYVSNYPRYYYRSLYHGTDINNIRGYNENVRKPIYTSAIRRTQMNELSRNNKSDVQFKMTRQPRDPNYYGKSIGQSVKVQRQMRQINQSSQNRGSHGENQIQRNQSNKQGNERRK